MSKKIVVPGLGRLPAFCHACIAGDYIYVSGTLGIVGDKIELLNGTKEQTKQIMKNFEIVLNACNASLSDIIKVNVYLKDINDFPEMNEPYLEAIGNENPPARITVGGVQLALDANIEMDCIAYKKN